MPVVATDWAYYLLDHHHLLAALQAANIPESAKRAVINVTYTFSPSSESVGDAHWQFWRWMLRTNNTVSAI